MPRFTRVSDGLMREFILDWRTTVETMLDG
jgi:hypothetical protein